MGMNTKYAAFLRGINVGGHKIIKMEDLRRKFESFGCLNVATFIQSGNVLFEAAETETGALEARVQAKLARSLGYEVEIFLRTLRDVTAIIKNAPFAENANTTLYVTFLHRSPSRAAMQALMKLASRVDEFAVQGREVYCLRHRDRGESILSTNLLEKTLGMSATMRNITSIRKIAEKYG